MNVALTTRCGHMVPCFSGAELLVIPPDQDLDRCEPVSTADWPPLAWGRELAGRDVSGTWVIFGCVHAGIINSLQYVCAFTGNRPIHAVSQRHAPAQCNSRTTGAYRRRTAPPILTAETCESM